MMPPQTEQAMRQWGWQSLGNLFRNQPLKENLADFPSRFPCMVTARRAWFFYCLFSGCLMLAMTVADCPAKTLRTHQADDSGAAAIILKIFLEGVWPQPDVRVESVSTLVEFDSNRDGVLTETESMRARATIQRRLRDIERIRRLFELWL